MQHAFWLPVGMKAARQAGGLVCRGWRAGAGARGYAWLSAIAVLYWFGMLLGEGFYLATAIWVSDITIPANAAVAWRENVSLHSDFYSQFGWLYFAHCGAAAWLLEMLIGAYSLFDLLLTVNFLALLVISMTLWAVASWTKMETPAWLPIVLFLIFFSNMVPGFFASAADRQLIFKDIIWSEHYNRTWAAALAVYGYMVCVALVGRRAVLAWRMRAAVALLGGLGAAAAALYKLNFMPAFACLFAAFCCADFLAARARGDTAAWRRMARAAVFFAVATLPPLAAALLGGYDFAAYWQDLQPAVAIRKQEANIVTRLQSAPILLAAAAGCWSARVLWGGRDKTAAPRWAELLFWLGFWLALFFCIWGVTSTFALMLYLLVLWGAIMAWLLRGRMPGILQAAAAGALLIFTLPMAWNTAWQSMAKWLPDAAASETLRIYQGDRYYFAARRDRVERFMRFELFDEEANGAEVAHVPGEAFAGQVDEARAHYDNWRSDAPGAPRLSVAVMAYEDPLPFFRGAPMNGKMHWKHLWVNMSPGNDAALRRELAGSDMALLGAKHLDESRAYSACWFLTSDAAAVFDYAGSSSHWHVFVRRGAASVRRPPSFAMTAADIIRQPWLARRCGEILSHPLQVGKTPLYAPTEKTYRFARHLFAGAEDDL